MRNGVTSDTRMMDKRREMKDYLNGRLLRDFYFAGIIYFPYLLSTVKDFSLPSSLPSFSRMKGKENAEGRSEGNRLKVERFGKGINSPSLSLSIGRALFHYISYGPFPSRSIMKIMKD